MKFMKLFSNAVKKEMTDKPKKKPRDESLLVEYKLSQEMHTYYGTILWKIGAIFIPISLGGFAVSVHQNLSDAPLIVVTLVLTGLLGWFMLSARRLRHLAFLYILRCEEIEKILGLKQHTNKHQNDTTSVTVTGIEISPQRFTGKDINTYIPTLLLIMFWGYNIYKALT